MAENQIIHITFRAAGPDGRVLPPMVIPCMPSDKVSDIIEKYRNKANDRDSNKKFIFNAHVLDPLLTVTESGIEKNLANIFVVSTK